MTVIVATVYLPYTVTFDMEACNAETIEASRDFPVHNSGGTTHGIADLPSNDVKSSLAATKQNAAPVASAHNPALASHVPGKKEPVNVTSTTKRVLPDIIQSIKKNTDPAESRGHHLDPEQEFFLGKYSSDQKHQPDASEKQPEDIPLSFAVRSNGVAASQPRRRQHSLEDEESNILGSPIGQATTPPNPAFEYSTDDVDENTPGLVDVSRSGPSSGYSSLSSSVTSTRAPSPAPPSQGIVSPRKPIEPQYPAMRIAASALAKRTVSGPGTPLSVSNIGTRKPSAINLAQLNANESLTSANPTLPHSKSETNVVSVNNQNFSVFFPENYSEMETADKATSPGLNAHSIALEKLSNLHSHSRTGRKGLYDITPLLDRVHFKIERQKSGNGGLRNAIKRAMARKDVDDVLWVGHPGMSSEALSSKARSSLTKTLREKYNNVPVFTKESVFDGCYTHYCKQILWPTMHYQIPDHPKSKAYEDHSWDHYRAFNQAVADSIVEVYKPGDTIWVNDYHLLLVPAMVREKLPNAEIGFFLHIAFPSSEVFRVLAARKELLEGVLASNCIGFQIDEYRRHFLQTCNRILAVDFAPNGVRMNNRFISVIVNPIGIDPSVLDLYMKAKDVRKWQADIRERYSNVTLFVSRDKLDPVRGIKEKLEGYEMFLRMHPEMIGKVTLIQVCLMNKAEADLESDVSVIVERINGLRKDLASPAPCIFLHQDIDFAIYIALLYEASAFAVTSLREGMNLTSHEFVYCNDLFGPLILSEFTGAASDLGTGAILVNPWDRREMAEAFYQATVMTVEEKRLRWSIMNDQVMAHTCETWVERFISELNSAFVEEQRRAADKIPILDVEKLRKDYQSLNNQIASGTVTNKTTPENTPSVGPVTPHDTPSGTPSGTPRTGSALNMQPMTQLNPLHQKKTTVLKKRIFFLDLDSSQSTSVPPPVPAPNAPSAVSSPQGKSHGIMARPLVRRTSSTISIFDTLDERSSDLSNTRASSSSLTNMGGIFNSTNLSSSNASSSASGLSRSIKSVVNFSDLKKNPALGPSSGLELESSQAGQSFTGSNHFNAPITSFNPLSSASSSVFLTPTSSVGSTISSFSNHIPGSSTSINFGASTLASPISKVPTSSSMISNASNIIGPGGAANRRKGDKTIIFQSPQRKISLLYELVNDPQNIVYVVSSDSRRSLDRILKRAGNIGIIAENGAFMRPFGDRKSGNDEIGEKREQYRHMSIATLHEGTIPHNDDYEEDAGDGWIGLIDSEKTKQWKEQIRQFLLDQTRDYLEGAVIEEEKYRIIVDLSRCLEENDDIRTMSSNSVDVPPVSGTTVLIDSPDDAKSAAETVTKVQAELQDDSSQANPLSDEEIRGQTERQEKVFTSIGSIIAHVNDIFTSNYNVHATFNASTSLLEIYSESASKLGAIKRAFDRELKKCEKQNQEVVSAVNHTMNTSSSAYGSNSAGTTPRASRRSSINTPAGSSGNLNYLGQLFDSSFQEETIDMIFIASEGGEPESDMAFEWASGLRHVGGSNTGGNHSTINSASGNSLSSIAAAAVGGSMSSMSTPVINGNGINSPFGGNTSTGPEWTGLGSPNLGSSPFGRSNSGRNSSSNLSGASETASSASSNSDASILSPAASNIASIPLATYSNSNLSSSFVSTPLSTLQEHQKKDIEKSSSFDFNEDFKSQRSETPENSLLFPQPPTFSNYNPNLLNTNLSGNGNGSPGSGPFSPTRAATVSPLSSAPPSQIQQMLARRSSSISQAFPPPILSQIAAAQELSASSSTSSFTSLNSSSSAISDIGGSAGSGYSNSGNNIFQKIGGSSLASSVSAPAASTQQHYTPSHSSGPFSVLQINTSVQDMAGSSGSLSNLSSSSSSNPVSSLPSAVSLTSIGGSFGFTANTHGTAAVPTGALSENPIVYTVSMGGTGTYAESTVDGDNGLVSALVNMLGPNTEETWAKKANDAIKAREEDEKERRTQHRKEFERHHREEYRRRKRFSEEEDGEEEKGTARIG